MKTGILGKKVPCKVNKEWINSLGLKWSMKNICYMDFTCLVGDLCYCSKFCFSPCLCYEEMQWFSLSICQDSVFSVKEVTKSLSAGLQEHSCTYRADLVLGGKPLEWWWLREGRCDAVIYKSTTACLLSASVPTQITEFTQLFPKWSRRQKRTRNYPDLRSPFPQLLRLPTWPQTAENNYPLSKMERSREEIVPFWNAVPPGLGVLWSSTAALIIFYQHKKIIQQIFRKLHGQLPGPHTQLAHL